MNIRRFSAIGMALAIVVALQAWANQPAEFSAEATALPFPPDARELEFVAWAGDIKYSSHSPLKSIAAFYLKEMAARGWEHEESAARVEEDSIKLKFKHGKVEVAVDLRQSSKEAQVSLDCEKLSFSGVDDPAKLAAAGIPVSRSAVFVQKELLLPEGAVDLRYTAEGCTFKSPLKLQEAFDYFGQKIPGKGFRESRRPIVTATRRYTEFKKGAAELSVNVFTDAVGSRIILAYKDNAVQKSAPPLAAVVSLPIKGGGSGNKNGTVETEVPADATPVDITGNKGSASVNYVGKQYTFANVAALVTKSSGGVPTVVFSAKPIPYNKMQSQIATKNSFSFLDLYELSAPDHLILQLGEHPSFSLGLPGISVGNPIEKSGNEMKVEGDRVRGTLKTAPVEIFRGEKLSFNATVDAALLTPSTRISGPGDPVTRSDSPVLANAPVPFPDAVENASSEGSKFRKTYRVVVRMPLAEVNEFYRKELTAKGWKWPETGSGETVRFKNESAEAALTLKPQGSKTEVEVFSRDMALAKQEGILPEAGKGRLVFGNAGNGAVTFSVGNTNYSLKPGQGAKDYRQAVNQSLAPGTYTVVIKIAGQAPQSEKIGLADGSAWGIVVLPMGGCLPVQLY